MTPDAAHAGAAIPAHLRQTGAPAFWGVVITTGVGAGLAAALLMSLLSAVQRLVWSAPNPRRQ